MDPIHESWCEGLNNVYTVDHSGDEHYFVLRKRNLVRDRLLVQSWLGPQEYSWFVRDLNYVNVVSQKSQEPSLKCPLCRTLNTVRQIDDMPRLTGLTNNCTVCLFNPVSVAFPSCGHVPLCLSCYLRYKDIEVDKGSTH